MGKTIGVFLAASVALSAATLQVGPDKTFRTPCAAVAVAWDGDVIEIDASLYKKDVCTIPQNNLTLRGANGRAHLDAGDASAQGQAIWLACLVRTMVDRS